MDEGNYMKSKKRHKKEYREKKTKPKKSFEVQPEYYPCDKCKRKLKSELSFKKHQEMHDSKEQSHNCHICKEGK